MAYHSQFGYSAPPYGAVSSTPALPDNADTTKAQLNRTHQSWSRTHQEIQDLISERSSTPYLSYVEVQAKDRQIIDLQHKLHEYEGQMARLEHTINQQRATIRQQSQTIQNPKKHFTTPHHPDGRQNPYQPTPLTNQSPPTWSLPAASQEQHGPPFGAQGPGPAFRAEPPSFMQPQSQQPRLGTMGSSRPYTANDWGSPEANRTHATKDSSHISNRSSNSGGYPTPNSSQLPSGNAQPSSRPASRGHPSNTDMPNTFQSQTLVRLSESMVDPDLKQALQKIFDMSEKYAYAHANHPSTAGDNALPQAIKEKLMKAAGSHNAFPLMTTPQTRYLLVARVVNQWLVKHVMKYNTYTGFDKRADQAIEKAKSQIYECKNAPVSHLTLADLRSNSCSTTLLLLQLNRQRVETAAKQAWLPNLRRQPMP